MNRIKHLTLLGLLTAIALIIFIIESAIPPIVPIPGIKLGLANIITLVALLELDKKSCLMIIFTRVLISALFMGHPIYFLYSIAGALLSFVGMVISSHFLQKKYIWFTSIIGAISHNIGQILIAIWLLKSPYIFYYLPFLAISSVITGLFIGFVVHLMIKRNLFHITKK